MQQNNHVKDWKRHIHNQKQLEYYHKYQANSKRYKERQKLNMRKLRQKNPNYGRGASFLYKEKAFLLISPSGIMCARCGCTDIRFLELNHINGDGARLRKNGELMGAPLYRKIINGKRKTDDLEILCRPCNHIHYLEFKFKEQIPLMVVWKP